MASRLSVWARGALPVLTAGLACACGATNTGNPAHPTAPDGVDFINSRLSREVAPEVSETERSGFGESSRDFALDLYREARAGKDGNLFISPYSVRAALGMLFAGAEGETETEMRTALRFGLPEPTLHAAFNATDLALSGRGEELAGEDFGGGPERPESSGDLILRPVNAAFGQRGLAFVPEYLDILALHYGSGMYAADFATDPERERMAINAWVERQTEDRIEDLIPMGAIDPMVALVLVNAIYFKGSWLEPFDASRTADEVFHAPGGDVTAPTMNGFAETYAEGDGYRALELPYIAPAVRMLFILPDEGRFDEIEAGLDRAAFDRIRGELSRYSVVVKIPKFRFESSFELVAAMKALGMNQAFMAGRADLSGIAAAPGDLFVSDILHKTFVALDEQGTEAAAATAVIVRATSAPPPAEFFLDRPCLFAIYDEPTGQILFLGRLMDPTN